MEGLRRLARRIRMLGRRDAVERTLAEEIRYHIECETDELMRRGLPRDSARRQAIVAFGGIEQIKEDVRDVRGTRAVDDGVTDLRYAARVLRRNPGFTIASVLTFGLGIGVATAIFSVVYGVLLRPLPYAHPERLMALWERDTSRDRDRNVVSLENFEAWRIRAGSFAGLAALMPTSMTLTERPEPERLVGAEVSTGYFRLLGVSPALGRDFVEADATGPLVTILSDGLWKRRFGGDPAVVGRVITVSGKPCTIVGVMRDTFDPPRFGWLGSQALWFPMVISPDRHAWGRFLLVVGRLREGVAIEQSRAELRAIASQLETEIPADKGWSASVVPLKTEMTGDARTTLLVLLGAVSLLLVMAVTNVGTLTLSAMRKRGHELAIRRAIGATNGRLFRQLFVQTRDLVIRTDGAPESTMPLLRSAVAALDPSLPLYAVTTLPDLVDTTLAPERFTMYVLTAFAMSAIFLAAVGVFGVLVGDVTRRRREIGIRLALGAPGSRVVLLLLRRSLLCAAGGVVAGIILAVVLGGMMTTLLFGVHPADPVSLAAVASLVLVVATTATLLPALRAIRHSPLSALRQG